jgi:50S ribosomal protein L16 3-hydroxylase
MLLGGMTTKRFLAEHWQKKPLLVRGAVSGFRDPLTPDELAGLSCEDGVESRIVRERGGACPWEVSYGPHAEARFGELPDRGWTLLVQELNRHVPAAASLLDRFAFLPNVRVDDVMVSFAAPGGSVGPHVDSYDVFLVQGRGRRRWMYGRRPILDASFVPGLELRILERFEPDFDEVLEPGDMLYLPPGVAHHGVAVTPCLTYSVGFRAPVYGEMWKEFGAHLASRGDPAAALLVTDPPLSPADEPGAIPPALLARVRRAIRAMDTKDESIDRWFASFATRLKPGHEMEPARRPRGEAALLASLRAGSGVRRSEEGRFAFLPKTKKKTKGAKGKPGLYLYVGGAEIDVPGDAADLARLVCRKRVFEGPELARAATTASARALLTRLFAAGALHLTRPLRAPR